MERTQHGASTRRAPSPDMCDTALTHRLSNRWMKGDSAGQGIRLPLGGCTESAPLRRSSGMLCSSTYVSAIAPRRCRKPIRASAPRSSAGRMKPGASGRSALGQALRSHEPRPRCETACARVDSAP